MRGLVAVAAALALGCSQKSEQPAPPDLPEPSAAQPPAGARPRSNVKVPLPDGWTASIAADQSFRAGPPGHAVLRIDLRPGAAAAMPTARDLEAELKKNLGAAVRFQRVDEKSEKDSALITYLLTPASTRDAGSAAAAEAPGMLGAKRAGKDLFLCSTVPGSSDDEVEQAARACAALSVPET